MMLPDDSELAQRDAENLALDDELKACQHIVEQRKTMIVIRDKKIAELKKLELYFNQREKQLKEKLDGLYDYGQDLEIEITRLREKMQSAANELDLLVEDNWKWNDCTHKIASITERMREK